MLRLGWLPLGLPNLLRHDRVLCAVLYNHDQCEVLQRPAVWDSEWVRLLQKRTMNTNGIPILLVIAILCPINQTSHDYIK